VALPSDGDIEIALLWAIVDAGGEARPRDAYRAVTARFPQLTDDDIRGALPSGGNRWTNRIQWVRQGLVASGQIHRKPHGVWRITDKGRDRLKLGSGLQPPPPPAPPDEGRPHRQLQNQLREIGAMLGCYSATEYRLDPYQYDVIWKRDEWQPSPGNVFEVQHHGNLEAALLKLKHAHDVCKPKLCLVVTGEGDQKKVSKMLGPLFSGVFHEIKSRTLVLTAQQVTELHESLSRHRDVLTELT